MVVTVPSEAERNGCPGCAAKFLSARWRVRIMDCLTRTGRAFGVAIVATLPMSGMAGGRWGEQGHRIIAQAAALALPGDARGMPPFFRQANEQLAYLNPEPDRWRDSSDRALDPAADLATAPDHFIDLELLPAPLQSSPLGPRSRYEYADSLRASGRSPQRVGFLPFAILELTLRLRTDFRLWRAAPNDQLRRWIEERVIDDAGILGHYVADGSNPSHTTVHFNGWTGNNPHGYATDKRFHMRFEVTYVQTHLALADVAPLVEPSARLITSLRPAITQYLGESNAQVEQMYALDSAEPFDAETKSAAHKQFVAERLAAGARMLRDLWWTAWVTSAQSAVPGDD